MPRQRLSVTPQVSNVVQIANEQQTPISYVAIVVEEQPLPGVDPIRLLKGGRLKKSESTFVRVPVLANTEEFTVVSWGPAGIRPMLEEGVKFSFFFRPFRYWRNVTPDPVTSAPGGGGPVAGGGGPVTGGGGLVAGGGGPVAGSQSGSGGGGQSTASEETLENLINLR